MADLQGLSRAFAEGTASRRTLLVAAAWTAPVVVAIAAVPAYASSISCVAGSTAMLTVHDVMVTSDGDGSVPTGSFVDGGTTFKSGQGPGYDGFRETVLYVFDTVQGADYTLHLNITPSNAGDSVVLLDVQYSNYGDINPVVSLAAGPSGAPNGYLYQGDRYADFTPTSSVLAGGGDDGSWLAVLLTITYPDASRDSYGSFTIAEPVLSCLE